ncbi:DUF3352 domain-containing protein [Candidatus Poribacteria bacterium]|nr:DUF3352 domain-containing protein [Candidatus Poribacteria bacterium]
MRLMFRRRNDKIGMCKLIPGRYVMKINLLISIVIVILLFANTPAFSQQDSVVRVIPENSSIIVKISNPRNFDLKLSKLMNSLEIDDVPHVSMAMLLKQSTGTDVHDIMALEGLGFDMKRDACIFWNNASFNNPPGVAVHIASLQKAQKAIEEKIGGDKKEYKGVTYGQPSPDSAWVFLDDIFVYSKKKSDITDAIETHLKDKPSIADNGAYTSNIKNLRSGDVLIYVSVGKITVDNTSFLENKLNNAKAEMIKQMKQQGSSTPYKNMNVANLVSSEMDIGLWLLKQIKSYSFSLGIERSGVWFNDSLKVFPASPVCPFLKNMKPSRMRLINQLPGDIFMAGGMTVDSETYSKINEIMLDIMLESIAEDIQQDELAFFRDKYKKAVDDMMSCLGDEIAYAFLTDADKTMPRVVYIIDLKDREKARKTLGNLDYMEDLIRPMNKAFGLDFKMSKGPSQNYTGVNIKSFQMDLGEMNQNMPNRSMNYPDRVFTWYAFVDDKIIYAVSQSASTIKTAIDSIKGRGTSIQYTPGFDELNIRLSHKSNMSLYVAPSGYMKFIMNMMVRQMGGRLTRKEVKPGVGFAASTRFNDDGLQNTIYFRISEIQNFTRTINDFSQMAGM